MHQTPGRLRVILRFFDPPGETVFSRIVMSSMLPDLSSRSQPGLLSLLSVALPAGGRSVIEKRRECSPGARSVFVSLSRRREAPSPRGRSFVTAKKKHRRPFTSCASGGKERRAAEGYHALTGRCAVFRDRGKS
ncbi:hypothetical protein CesoFtcFv8_019341 [Champsocephalus esox]|uniref:Uncharacterized protein n=1 Tax=Champsocephalus esox TaxID=159716 RepID=A0AAN8BIX1_9TELE|nr:hypothetical protein CesoFtcFv8_019341 [Champsocephalus esox]